MNIVVEYLRNCYPTVMALLTIIVMVELTKRSGIFEKTGRIYIMVLLTFALSLLEFAEIWIDEHNLNYRLLFYKAMLIYSFLPISICLPYIFRR